jgi:cytochrome c biogenesis protein CcdA
MLLLILFALLAGAGTALSPCALPVLPALLSAGGVGGRRRPLGVVVGLGVTFAVAIIGISNVVDGVGLGNDPLRVVAIVVLIAFGAVMLIPELAQRLEAPLARLSRLGPRTKGTGFGSGLLVGGALGFVYTPCAGPILASVISVGAATGRTIPVGIAYAVGSSIALLLLALGGRAAFDRIRKAGGGVVLQRSMGVIMLLTAVAIIARLDVKFDQFIARNIPNFSLTSALESSNAVKSRLPDITGHKQKFVITPADQKKIDAVAKFEESIPPSSSTPTGAVAGPGATRRQNP